MELTKTCSFTRPADTAFQHYEETVSLAVAGDRLLTTRCWSSSPVPHAVLPSLMLLAATAPTTSVSIVATSLNTIPSAAVSNGCMLPEGDSTPITYSLNAESGLSSSDTQATTAVLHSPACSTSSAHLTHHLCLNSRHISIACCTQPPAATLDSITAINCSPLGAGAHQSYCSALPSDLLPTVIATI